MKRSGQVVTNDRCDKEGRLMIKIRVMGKPRDVEEAVKRLGNVFRVLDVSKPYRNRRSEYVRVYVEIEQ